MVGILNQSSTVKEAFIFKVLFMCNATFYGYIIC